MPSARNILGDRRDSFSHYYVPNVEIKDFDVFDRKTENVFFDLPVKIDEEAYEKIINMSNNNYYTSNWILVILKKIVN